MITERDAFAVLELQNKRQASKLERLTRHLASRVLRIREIRAARNKEAEELREARAELATVTAERDRYQALAFERKDELEKAANRIASLERKVREISAEYIAFHKKTRERERKKARERRLLISELQGKFARHLLKSSAEPLKLVLNKPVKRRKR